MDFDITKYPEGPLEVIKYMDYISSGKKMHLDVSGASLDIVEDDEVKKRLKYLEQFVLGLMQ